MKRYRIINLDFDSRPSILAMRIEDHWEEAVKDSHLQSKETTYRSLLKQFGTENSDIKAANYIELGNKPFSVIAYHNKFLDQIRNSYVMSCYYPALTGVCALGERILNHLILKLRDYYKNTPEYRKVYRKNSFDNWNVPIDTLENWGVLLPDVVKHFRDLREIRNKAIHFTPDIDHNDRELSLSAIRVLSKIIERQFGVFGGQPWFIRNAPGVCFLRKEAEQSPFIKMIYVPNSFLVGPKHELEFVPQDTFIQVLIHDHPDYEDKEVTDEEFVHLYLNRGN